MCRRFVSTFTSRHFRCEIKWRKMVLCTHAAAQWEKGFYGKNYNKRWQMRVQKGTEEKYYNNNLSAWRRIKSVVEKSETRSRLASLTFCKFTFGGKKFFRCTHNKKLCCSFSFKGNLEFRWRGTIFASFSVLLRWSLCNAFYALVFRRKIALQLAFWFFLQWDYFTPPT